nr:uncharacterized protein LOC127334877 [Lolium perenne]
MELGEVSPGPGLPRPPELDSLFTDEAWASLSEERRRLIISDDDEEESHIHQLRQARKDRRIRRKALQEALPDMHPGISLDSNLPLSRDVRDSDLLLWIREHRIRNLSESLLGPMRYTSCELLGNRCAHHPRPMLHFFGISVKFYRHDLKLMCDSTKHSYIDIYGLIAVRDSLDFARNTIFHRSRENAQPIDLDGGYLRLCYPARGISAMGCLIEIDIKIKGKKVEEDFPVIDGSVKARGQFEPWTINHVDDINGKIIFESCVVRKGVEATIDLDFMEVPSGGFHVQMCGSTLRHKAFYNFINERCDAEDFIASPGKHGKKFVAAVNIGDTLRIDFRENGREALSFVACKHGNKRQLYRFNNGAVVSVRVFWSAIVSDRPFL